MKLGPEPYRTVIVRPPASPRRPLRLALLVALLAVVGGGATLALRSRRPVHRPPPAPPVAERPSRRTMHGFGQVSIVVGEGARAAVVRVPGRLVRRGADFVTEVEIVPAPEVTELMPQGEWALDSRDEPFVVMQLPQGEAPCAPGSCFPPIPGHARVAEMTFGGLARLADGAVLRRDARAPQGWATEPGPRVVDLSECGLGRYELYANGEVVYRDRRDGVETTAARSLGPALRVDRPVELVSSPHGDVLCVRGSAGDTRCGVLTEGPPELGSTGPLTLRPLSGLPPRSAAIALGRGQLCRVGDGGELACADLPRPPLRAADSTALTLAPVEGLRGVREVALGSEVGCARLRSGEVWCWGATLDAGGVERRDRPVAMAGIDAAELLADAGNYVCALQRGEVLCWGDLVDEERAIRPTPIATGGGVTGVAASGRLLCVTRADGELRCWSGDPFTQAPRTVAEIPAGGFHALVGTERRFFALDALGRAWTNQRDYFHPLRFERIPAFDGYERIVVGATDCARRGATLTCLGRDDLLARRPFRDRRAPRAGAPSELLSAIRPAETTVFPGLPVLGALLPGGVRPAATGAFTHCLLGVDGRVACRWSEEWPRDSWEYTFHIDRGPAEGLVPGLDDAVEIAAARSGLYCARRAGGGVVCWGYNGGGSLTADESAHAPTLHRLDDLIARARVPLPTAARRRPLSRPRA